MVLQSKSAAELKAEGNNLYTKKKYAEAYEKYTAAIVEDANNAVLYANRAACSLGQHKWATL